MTAKQHISFYYGNKEKAISELEKYGCVYGKWRRVCQNFQVQTDL